MCVVLLQKCFSMDSSDSHEVEKTCDRLPAAELAFGSLEQSDDKLKLLLEKWSRYL